MLVVILGGSLLAPYLKDDLAKYLLRSVSAGSPVPKLRFKIVTTHSNIVINVLADLFREGNFCIIALTVSLVALIA